MAVKAIKGVKVTYISFPLHNSQKTNERNSYGYLAPDFEHHSKGIDEIFKNKIVLNGFKELIIQSKAPFLSKISTFTLSRVSPDKYFIDFFKKNFNSLQKILEDELITLMKITFGDTEKVALDIVNRYINSVPKKAFILNKPKFTGIKQHKIIDKKTEKTKYIPQRKYEIKGIPVKDMDDKTLKKNINDYFEVYTTPDLDELIKNHKHGANEVTFIDRGKVIGTYFEEFLKYPSLLKMEKIENGKKIPYTHLDVIKVKGKSYLDSLPKMTDSEKTEIEKGNYRNIYKSLDHLNFYLQHKGTLPQFNGSQLALIIGSVWAYESRIKKFIIRSDNAYDYELEFTLYDHYSLDEGDFEIKLNELGLKNVFGPALKKGTSMLLVGFSAWYILQFFDKYLGCTPLVVKSTFSYTRKELL
jgi:hypothetical protein